MKIFLTVALAVACVALAFTLFLYFDVSAENRTLSAQLITTETSLNLTRSELTAAEAEIAAGEQALASTQDELTETESILAETQYELVAAAEEYRTVSASLAASERNAADLQESLSEANARLVLTETTLAGLGITVAASTENWDAVLIDNDEAYDPSLAELKAFLAEDRTEYHEYILGVYDGSEFSRDIHNRAEAAGIRAGVVHIWWQNDPVGHALNVFHTRDYGLVYVDSTEEPDRAARVVKGKTYRGTDIDLVPPQFLRSDIYWDNLTTYNYIQAANGGQAVTQGIEIYW